MATTKQSYGFINPKKAVVFKKILLKINGSTSLYKTYMTQSSCSSCKTNFLNFALLFFISFFNHFSQVLVKPIKLSYIVKIICKVNYCL